MKANDYIWEILVPHKWNDGVKVSISYHKEWDKKVRKIADGLTILKLAKGQWVANNGTLYSEKMIPVRIACTKKEMEVIARMTLQHYNQIKVMYYRIADEVHIYP